MEEQPDPCCPMVASWVSIPAAACSILAFKFILEFHNILIFILIGVLSVGLLYIAITLTICFKMNKFGIAVKIATYIALVFSVIYVLFAFVYFFYGFVLIIRSLKNSSLFKTIFKNFGVMIPCLLFSAMQFNVVTAGKSGSGPKEESLEDGADGGIGPGEFNTLA